MNTRMLGAAGPMVAPVGIGAMSFAGVYGQTSDQEAHAILDAALELGINHIDTSNVYGMGQSEKMIGSYLAKHGPAVRDQFVIATKAGIMRDPDSGVRYFNNSRDHLAAELDGSLKRLGTDCVDLFYVHRRQADVEIEDVTHTLASFIADGKIRAFGYSEIAPTSLRRANAVHPVAAVQSEYSLSTRYAQLGLVQECDRSGTSLVAFSPVGRGLLTDTPPDRARVDKIPFLQSNPRFMGSNLAANIAAVKPFQQLAADMGTSSAALAIAWLLAQSDRVITIPGTRSVSHLGELAAGAELKLSQDDLARINVALPVGWAHGDRYSVDQWNGPEKYS